VLNSVWDVHGYISDWAPFGASQVAVVLHHLMRPSYAASVVT